MVAASSTPPSAGPTNMLVLSIDVVTTLAAVSSWGPRASDGISADFAGSKAVPTMPFRVEMPKIRASGAVAAIDAAIAPASATRARSEVTITRTRSWRSASVATKGAARPEGTRRATICTPTAVAPPRSKA